MTMKIDCIALDGKYETDDYQVNIRLIIDKMNNLKLLTWDGLQWSDEKGLNRLYTDETSQLQYDDFIHRLLILEKERLLYEVATSLQEDQSFYFEKERIYLYVDKKMSE